MSVFDIQPERIDLSPQNVAGYLGATGWDLQLRDDAREVWRLLEGGTRVAMLTLPRDPSYVDYEIRFQEALSRLCMVYDWDLQQLATNILSARSDVLYIRADQFTRDGSIPLSQARSLLDGASHLVEAAALASLDPRPNYSGRRPNSVRDFVEDEIRMGHTQRGSFVITILTRLDEDDVITADDVTDIAEEGEGGAGSAEAPSEVGPNPAPSHDDLDGPLSEPTQEAERDTAGPVRLPPFQRRVMSTLASALVETVSLTGTDGFKGLERAVTRGVSANLCQSLATMTEYEGLRALDLSFLWAPAALFPAPDTDQVVIDRDHIPNLAIVSERLKRVPDRVRTTIFGQVTRLERGADDDEGVVTIRGVVGRSTRRSVRIHLAGPQYDDAIRAHRGRIPVSVTGDMQKEGNSYVLSGDLVIEFSTTPQAE
jgi:hypothetical protein